MIQLCNLDTDEALKIHIEGLQSTLGKRNARIKELEEKLSQPVDMSEKMEKVLKKAYKEGWKACAKELMGSTELLVRALQQSKKASMEQYLRTDIYDV